MEAIFPFIEIDEEMEPQEEELRLAREYAWDFERMDFKYKNGKMYFVEGNEAIKIWLWKLFKTNRFRELIYSWDYGHELEDLIGQGFTEGYLNSEAERYVREAIEYNIGEYATDIQNMEVGFKGDKLTVEFKVITPYGEVDIIA